MAEHNLDAAAPPLTVLYDGACPLCRREIGLYRGLQPNAPVCYADVSDPASPLPSGTTREQLLEIGRASCRERVCLAV